MTTINTQCPACYGHGLLEQNDTTATCHHCNGTGYVPEQADDQIYPRLARRIDEAIRSGERTISVSPDDARLMRLVGYVRDEAGTKISRELGHGKISMFVTKPEPTASEPQPEPTPAANDETNDALNDVMTAAEAATEFGLAEATVRQAINRGQLPARKSAGTWLVLRSDVEARWGQMDFQQAIDVLTGKADGDKSDAYAAICDEVIDLCEADTDNIEDWISHGDYHGDETPESIAAEWDSLQD